MFEKTISFAKAMGCCNCFGFIRRRSRRRAKPAVNNNDHDLSQELLLDDDTDDDEERFYANALSGDGSEVQNRPKRSEDILNMRVENGLICRQFPVKETDVVFRSEVIIAL